MGIQEMKERLIAIILERSFKYSDNPPFKLVSGRTSNYYFNCKPTTLDPEGMNLIGEIIFEMLGDSGVSAAGMVSRALITSVPVSPPPGAGCTSTSNSRCRLNDNSRLLAMGWFRRGRQSRK